jgi:hypothetical protein
MLLKNICAALYVLFSFQTENIQKYEIRMARKGMALNMKNRENKLTLVIILAAVVAALTTLAVIFLRMRAKKRALASYGDTIDYDLDDCCCGEFDHDVDELHDIEGEEPVEIPLAEPEEDQ